MCKLKTQGILLYLIREISHQEYTLDKLHGLYKMIYRIVRYGSLHKFDDYYLYDGVLHLNVQD